MLKALGFATVFALSNVGSVFADETTQTKPFSGWDTRLSIKGGYARNDTRYPRGGDTQGVNQKGIYDVKLKHVEVWMFMPEINTTHESGFYGELKTGFGHVSDGQVRIDTFNESTGARASTFESCLNGVYTFDASAAVGWNIMPWIDQEMDHVLIRPLLGYSYHRQTHNIRDGSFTFGSAAAAENPFGADPRYCAKFYGPWAGLGVGFNFGTDTKVGPEHALGFRGIFNFLVQQETRLASIPLDSKRGYGYGFSAQYAYQFNSCIQLTTGFEWTRMDTDTIRTRTPSRAAERNLDHAVWDRWILNVGFVWKL